MKRLFIAANIVFTAGMLALPAAEVSVEFANDAIEALRSVIKADRKAVLSEAMRFTDAEAAAFWPVYQDYRTEMERVGDGIKQLVLEYGQHYPDVPDDRAKRMLKDILALEKEQVATRTTFMKRFSKVLSPARTLRLSQIESRLDLAIRAELAAHIPLVPMEGTLRGTEHTGVVFEEGVAGGVVVRTRKLSALVAAIDSANRRVTLVGADGVKETIKVGPEAINFDQIHLGDRLEVEATEALVVRLAEPGDSTDNGAAMVVDLAPKGSKPSGIVAGTTRVTGTVTAIDLSQRTATLKFEDGTSRTLPVRSDVDLARRKVGDRVIFQVTEMVALAVKKP